MRYLLLTFFTLMLLTTDAQKKPPNTNDFVLECMKMGGELPNRQMVLWLPSTFWEIVGGQMKVSPEYVRNLVKEMDAYMMFCVVDYSQNGTSLSFRPEDEIRKTLKLVDSSKTIYMPLDDKDISPTVLEMVNNLKPVMTKLMGQFGEGMRIFLFDARNPSGKSSFDLSSKNRFTLTWDRASLKWRLPFASILPLKYCPVDKEEMKGNWDYCPIHGVKLD